MIIVCDWLTYDNRSYLSVRGIKVHGIRTENECTVSVVDLNQSLIPIWAVFDWINFDYLLFILDDKLIILNKDLMRKLQHTSVLKSIRSMTSDVKYVYISMYVSLSFSPLSTLRSLASSKDLAWACIIIFLSSPLLVWMTPVENSVCLSMSDFFALIYVLVYHIYFSDDGFTIRVKILLLLRWTSLVLRHLQILVAVVFLEQRLAVNFNSSNPFMDCAKEVSSLKIDVELRGLTLEHYQEFCARSQRWKLAFLDYTWQKLMNHQIFSCVDKMCLQVFSCVLFQPLILKY